MSEMLKIDNIRKVFNPGTINEKVALDGVNLTLEEGEFVTVIGGNGAGKSTTLNAVAGVWPVDSGKIFIGGDDVTKLSLKLPCVVKPCCGGSSIGVTIVRNAAEFKAALDEAFRWENELVIEEYIEGREFSVGVMEGKALPVIEIAPIQGFYDYKNKYKAGSAVDRKSVV